MPILICTNVVYAVARDFALFCADFQSLCPCSVYESVGEDLKFTNRLEVTAPNRERERLFG